MYSLELIGVDSFDVTNNHGAYRGMIVSKPGKSKHYIVCFDSNGAKRSARKFSTVQDAAQFIFDRRAKKNLPQ